jgi:hypothetical protein
MQVPQISMYFWTRKPNATHWTHCDMCIVLPPRAIAGKQRQHALHKQWASRWKGLLLTLEIFGPHVLINMYQYLHRRIRNQHIDRKPTNKY